MQKKKIFQQIQSLREILIKTFATLNIALGFDGMKCNMSAIIKCKENIGSSCLFFPENNFFYVKVRKFDNSFGAIFSFDHP